MTHTILILTFTGNVGRDSVDSIGIRFGLDGPEIELQWRQSFLHPSRSNLGPT